MIVGLSSKKQHGKNLTAKIIQFLTLPNIDDYKHDPIEDILNYISKVSHIPGSNWEVKMFADKLKDIICLLFGCTRENLENEKFKNTELGEEWYIYRYRIQDKSGNPIYKHLYDREEQYKIITKESYNALSNEEKKFHNAEIIKPTPRKMLQFVGTDLFRKQLHPKTWVNATMANYKPLKNGAIGNRQPDDLDDCPVEFPKWIISDVRFPDEVEAIKERGGVVIRIERPSVKNNDTHISETSLDNYKDFDYTIVNNDNLNDLIEEVKKILEKENII
jgi:hypothetical protein